MGTRDIHEGLITVRCGNEQHKIFLHPSGAVVFINHSASVRALATEGTIRDGTHHDCFWFARELLNRSLPTVPTTTFWQQVATKRMMRLLHDDDPLLLPLRKRSSSGPAYEKALGYLKAAKFRTSKVEHRVILLGGIHSATSVSGYGEDAVYTKRKKLFAGKRQAVSLSLNLVEWAPVYLAGACLVQEHFVTRIRQRWGPNELEVDMLKQSVGYKVKIVPAIIRRANDGVWRIHEFLKCPT